MKIACVAFDDCSRGTKFYEKRDYRFIQYHQWSITDYRSVVMSKALYYEKILAL